MATKYKRTAVGVLRRCHVNKPDHAAVERWNAPLRFKAQLVLDGEKAEQLVAEIDAAINAKYEAAEAELSAADLKRMAKEGKKLTRRYPYQELEDEKGNPTGEVAFSFTQNVVIKLKDKTEKTRRIAIYDSAGKPMQAEVWGGTRASVFYNVRAYYNPATMEAGATLDFSGVQVSELRGPGGGGVAPLDEDDRHCFADEAPSGTDADGEDGSAAF